MRRYTGMVQARTKITSIIETNFFAASWQKQWEVMMIALDWNSGLSDSSVGSWQHTGSWKQVGCHLWGCTECYPEVGTSSPFQLCSRHQPCLWFHPSSPPIETPALLQGPAQIPHYSAVIFSQLWVLIGLAAPAANLGSVPDRVMLLTFNEVNFVPPFHFFGTLVSLSSQPSLFSDIKIISAP